MNALLLARFFPGRSLTLRNLTLSETREGSTRVTRIPNGDALPAAIERLFGIDEAVAHQALAGVQLTATV